MSHPPTKTAFSPNTDITNQTVMRFTVRLNWLILITCILVSPGPSVIQENLASGAGTPSYWQSIEKILQKI